MSISHNLENLSTKQKSDLEIAQTLLDNLNSLKPIPNFQNNSLIYDGEKFKINNLGYHHKFLVDDIHLAIKESYQNHEKFILDTFQKQVNKYLNSSKTSRDLAELEANSSRILKYYGFTLSIQYPLYPDESDFKKILENVSNSINSLVK